MSESLANDYRPDRLDDVLGHPQNVKMVRKMAETGKWPSSMLLSGPPGTGKTTMARVIAKLMICREPETRKTLVPCGKCEGCKSVDSLNGTNLFFLDGGAKDMTETIREDVLTFFNSRPIGGVPKTVLILDEFQRVSGAAKSVLLAPLEELPKRYPWVMAIFTTTDPDQIHEALRTRCFPMRFNPIPRDEMVQSVLKVEKLEPTPEVVEGLLLLAEAAQGCMRQMWVYIQQWHLLDEPMTPKVAASIAGGIDPDERQELWTSIQGGRIDRALALWDKWVTTGANPTLLGEMFTQDVVKQASLNPKSAPWLENLDLLARVGMLGKASAWRWAIAMLQPAQWREPDPVVTAIQVAAAEVPQPAEISSEAKPEPKPRRTRKPREEKPEVPKTEEHEVDLKETKRDVETGIVPEEPEVILEAQLKVEVRPDKTVADVTVVTPEDQAVGEIVEKALKILETKPEPVQVQPEPEAPVDALQTVLDAFQSKGAALPIEETTGGVPAVNPPELTDISWVYRVAFEGKAV